MTDGELEGLVRRYTAPWKALQGASVSGEIQVPTSKGLDWDEMVAMFRELKRRGRLGESEEFTAMAEALEEGGYDLS